MPAPPPTPDLPTPAAFAALCGALSAWLDGRPQPPGEGLMAAACPHKLAGMLYHIEADLDEVEAGQALTAWQRNLTAHLKRLKVLADRWPPECRPPLIFKGADLGEHLYRDPGARSASDLDLLLPDPWFEGAERALSAHAEAIRRPNTTLAPGDRVHEVGLMLDGVLLELHRDPQPHWRSPLDGGSLWARSQPGVIEGCPVRWPTPMDRIRLWLTDQINDAFRDHLRDYVDLALLLRALPEEARSRLPEALGFGLDRAWALARLRLEATGLWSGPPLISPRMPAAALWARWLPPIITPGGLDARRAGRRLLKLWLASVSGRMGHLRRLPRAISARIGQTPKLR